jgi:SAM-dependent methyltransferase
MNFYADETYGEHVAGVYDDWFSDCEPDSVELLATLAHGRPALELGIGTGRVALPLLAKGVDVQGIDAAPSMVNRLRAKPGGDRIQVKIGSFADVEVEGEFGLIYIVFNTFFALSSQAEQVRCFKNVAKHLAPDGCFLVEAFVPDLTRFTGGQVNWATSVTENTVQLDVGQHDAVAQRVNSQKVVINDGSVRLYPVQIRYVWPSEFDLMAQLAGLDLSDRWGSWQRTPFTSQSQKHISIYKRAS